MALCFHACYSNFYQAFHYFTLTCFEIAALHLSVFLIISTCSHPVFYGSLSSSILEYLKPNTSTKAALREASTDDSCLGSNTSKYLHARLSSTPVDDAQSTCIISTAGKPSLHAPYSMWRVLRQGTSTLYIGTLHYAGTFEFSELSSCCKKSVQASCTADRTLFVDSSPRSLGSGGVNCVDRRDRGSLFCACRFMIACPWGLERSGRSSRSFHWLLISLLKAVGTFISCTVSQIIASFSIGVSGLSAIL